jgi:hypothetical protein
MMFKKRDVLALSFCLISLVGITQVKSNKSFKTLKAIPCYLVAEAVGVNTHLNYLGSIYDIHYEDIIKPRLIELGAMHIRDHLGNEKISSRYTNLAHQHGIKLLLINDDDGLNIEKTRDEVIRLNHIKIDKPVVDLIEPANERDIGWKNDWLKLCGYLKRFSDIYKISVETTRIPLLGPSFANTESSAVTFSKECPMGLNELDYGNIHAYSGKFPESNDAGGWGISLSQAIANYQSLSRDLPLIETECGYKISEGLSGHPAVSQRSAAKYIPRLILERLKSGVDRVYIYQLINDQENFGLLETNGEPRLQFTALKNFISIFKDSSEPFNTSNLNFSLTGNLQNLHYMLFQKSNSKYLLVLWQGINGSEGGVKNDDFKDINNKDVPIQLHLLKKAEINIYRPSFNTLPDGNGINIIRTFKYVKQVNLKVPDHILIVEIKF